MGRKIRSFVFLFSLGFSLLLAGRPRYLEIPPGDWRGLDEALPEMPPVVNLALKRTPPWLRDSLYWKMRELSLKELRLNGQTSAALFDINQDGLSDLVVGTADGLLRFYLNIGSKHHPVFSGEKVYTPREIDAVDNAVPFPCDVDGDGDMDLVMGNNRGQVILYENQGLRGSWVAFRERQDFFVVKEKGKFKILDVGTYSVPVLYDFDGDGKRELLVGAGDGRLHYFHMAEEKGRIFWKELPLFNDFDFGKRTAPALCSCRIKGKDEKVLLVFNSRGEYSVLENLSGAWKLILKGVKPSWIWPPEKGLLIPHAADINGDGRDELLMGTSSGRVHLILNAGEKILRRETEGGPLSAGSQWLGGYDLIHGGTTPITRIKVFDPYYATVYARLILRVEKKILDEVAFSVSNTATKVLRAIVDAPPDKEGINYSPEVFRENALGIYRMAKLLPYAELVEKGHKTTLRLRFRDGKWRQLPFELYYWYVVHPRLRFEAPSFYLGKFWRKTIPNDRKYGDSALEVAKKYDNVYDAVKGLHRWSRKFVEWGEESHDKMPEEPYYANYGSCGEWSIYGVALGRSLLIPTRLANDWGEDHVWNEFYSEGKWHRWDLNFKTSKALDYPEVYEKEWKKFVSTIWSIRGDDMIYPISSRYTATSKVDLRVLAGKEPVAGAMVIVLSRWAVEKKYDKVPLLSIWGVTDEDGRVSFNLGEDRYEFVISAPGLGVKKIELSDPKGRNGHILEGKNYQLEIKFPSLESTKVKLPQRNEGAKPERILKLSFLSFERARVPLNYPAPYHYITGDEYKIPSRGKLVYMVLSSSEFAKFSRGEPFVALDYGPVSENLKVPKEGILVFYNLSRATWYRLRLGP